MKAESRNGDWTRRAFLISLPACAAPAQSRKGQTLPADWRRYPDPTTEFQVLRLTNPTYSSILPAHECRAVPRSGNYLIYASDRTGSWQAFRLDLKSGESRQLTEARAMNPATLTLTSDDRNVCYFDGGSMFVANLGSFAAREIYRAGEGIEPADGIAISDDGRHAVFVEKREGRYRLQLLRIGMRSAVTVVESSDPVGDAMPRPKRDGILYRSGSGALRLVNFDGNQDRPLKLEPGDAGPAVWSRDGRTVLYLNFPEDKTRLRTLREHTPDGNTDALIAATTQFVDFSRNGDASVFVGASLSKAAPHILILLRVTRRELTVCEHAATDPASVWPVFTPNSQRIFFQSDRHGKPALYAVSVDRLVEETSD